MAPSHTDWLYHRLRIGGPAAELAAFQAAAAGSGMIPWRLDFDRMEEDLFLRLAAPPAPQQRTLSLEGARLLAGELRDAVARRHAQAAARVGRSAACPLDLHALLPVPADVLRLGPDHPAALEWLWVNWGTTQALRHVRTVEGAGPRGHAAELRLSFWAADWTPWRALAALASRWPGLGFDASPVYERA